MTHRWFVVLVRRFVPFARPFLAGAVPRRDNSAAFTTTCSEDTHMLLSCARLAAAALLVVLLVIFVNIQGALRCKLFAQLCAHACFMPHAVTHGADHAYARTFAALARASRRVPTAARSRGAREARCCVRRRVNPVPSFSVRLQGPAAGDGWDCLARARTPVPLLGCVTVLEGGGGDGFAEGIAGSIADDASRAMNVTRGSSGMAS